MKKISLIFACAGLFSVAAIAQEAPRGGSKGTPTSKPAPGTVKATPSDNSTSSRTQPSTTTTTNSTKPDNSGSTSTGARTTDGSDASGTSSTPGAIKKSKMVRKTVAGTAKPVPATKADESKK